MLIAPATVVEETLWFALVVPDSALGSATTEREAEARTDSDMSQIPAPCFGIVLTAANMCPPKSANQFLTELFMP
jgi:hypothetical protein